ncbi:MAG: sigma 54-interacting transcriptional regulator [Polyangiales bacterium]
MSARIATVHTESLPGVKTGAAVQLVVIEGPDAGRAATVGSSPLLVGTGDDCALVLTDDRASRRHLSVAAEGAGFVVRDLGSTNGTVYEASSITEARVGLGATLKVGRSYLRLQPVARPVEVTPSRSRSFGELVGESLAMREVFAVLELAAKGDVTVLLEERRARARSSRRGRCTTRARRRGPFVAVDCGALPESLLESELFGHVRGAFTGASNTRAGAFARADGGTLFLDELSGVSASVQSRLLRAVETRRVRPVGSDAEREVDVRVVAASRHDLSTAVADGSFRADLYYRLSVLRVVLPPLRARREDIAPIVRAMLSRRGVEPGPIEGPNLDRLLAHDWPGNVRELRNVIDRALALSPGAAGFAGLRVNAPGEASAESDEGVPVRVELPWAEAKAIAVEGFERRYLAALMARSGGSLSAASRASGVDRKHLRALLKRHGMYEGDEG